MTPVAVLLEAECLISLALLVLALRFDGEARRFQRLLDGSERSYAKMEAFYLKLLDDLQSDWSKAREENVQLKKLLAAEKPKGRTRKLKVKAL